MTEEPRLPTLQDKRANSALNLRDSDVRKIAINKIRENPDNPRKEQGDLLDLARSIAADGLLEPLGVRYVPGEHDEYVVIFGSRRLAALNILWGSSDPEVSKKALMVDCRLLDIEDDDEAYVLAVAENIAREDLTPNEKAAAVEQIADRFPTWTNEEIGRRIGLDKSLVGAYLEHKRNPELKPFDELADANVLPRTTVTELMRAPVELREEIRHEIEAGHVPTIREVRERRQNPAPTPPLPSPTTFESGRELPFALGTVEIPQRPTTPPQEVTANNAQRHVESFLDAHWNSLFSPGVVNGFELTAFRMIEFVQHQRAQQKRTPGDD